MGLLLIVGKCTRNVTVRARSVPSYVTGVGWGCILSIKYVFNLHYNFCLKYLNDDRNLRRRVFRSSDKLAVQIKACNQRSTQLWITITAEPVYNDIGVWEPFL
jgi:hypothetical protein